MRELLPSPAPKTNWRWRISFLAPTACVALAINGMYWSVMTKTWSRIAFLDVVAFQLGPFSSCIWMAQCPSLDWAIFVGGSLVATASYGVIKRSKRAAMVAAAITVFWYFCSLIGIGE